MSWFDSFSVMHPKTPTDKDADASSVVTERLEANLRSKGENEKEQIRQQTHEVMERLVSLMQSSPTQTVKVQQPSPPVTKEEIASLVPDSNGIVSGVVEEETTLPVPNDENVSCAVKEETKFPVSDDEIVSHMVTEEENAEAKEESPCQTDADEGGGAPLTDPAITEDVETKGEDQQPSDSVTTEDVTAAAVEHPMEDERDAIAKESPVAESEPESTGDTPRIHATMSVLLKKLDSIFGETEEGEKGVCLEAGSVNPEITSAGCEMAPASDEPVVQDGVHAFSDEPIAEEPASESNEEASRSLQATGELVRDEPLTTTINGPLPGVEDEEDEESASTDTFVTNEGDTGSVAVEDTLTPESVQIVHQAEADEPTELTQGVREDAFLDVSDESTLGTIPIDEKQLEESSIMAPDRSVLESTPSDEKALENELPAEEPLQETAQTNKELLISTQEDLTASAEQTSPRETGQETESISILISETNLQQQTATPESEENVIAVASPETDAIANARIELQAALRAREREENEVTMPMTTPPPQDETPPLQPPASLKTAAPPLSASSGLSRLLTKLSSAIDTLPS